MRKARVRRACDSYIIYCHWIVGSQPEIDPDSGKEGIDYSKSTLRPN